MDKHLNLFKFFNNNSSVVHLENNLSRALVLSLQNDNLFLYKFLSNIIKRGVYKDDLDNLLSTTKEESHIEIDIQKSTRDLDQTDLKRIYAVALTESALNLSNFFELHEPKNDDYRPITDILISVDNIIFIIEVKRTGEDCKQQLFNQVYYAASKMVSQNIIVPVNFDWQEVMLIANSTKNFNLLFKSRNQFTNDFINLIRSYRTSWLPVSPFSVISEDSKDEDKRIIRLETCVLAAGESLKLLNKQGRIGFSFEKPWADEILPRWERTKEGKLYLKLYIWPANTKGQGWSLFYNENWEWLNLKEVELLGENFKLEIIHEIKFSHIQGSWVTSLNFTDRDLNKEINTTANFEKYAGEHKRVDWNRFENFLDSCFKEEFRWREKCGYEGRILETGKNFYNISLGYQVGVKIPYHFLQSIDKDPKDTQKMQELFIQCNEFYLDLLNKKPNEEKVNVSII